jgi:hypothetical protein
MHQNVTNKTFQTILCSTERVLTVKNCATSHQMSRLAYISSSQMAVGKEIGKYNDALFLLSKINLKSRSFLLINASSLNNSAENFQVSQERNSSCRLANSFR